MSALPCRVTADLNAYERRQEELATLDGDRRELATVEAHAELCGNLESFADALCDINDTLAHWNTTDAQMQKVGYLRGPLKRATALRALKAMQSLFADLHAKAPLTEREKAIADLIEVEVEYMREQRIQELVEAYS